MDIFSFILGIVLAAALILFVSRPLRQSRRDSSVESQLETLQARYESLLTQIRELDFDHATGKITEEDYAPMRAPLRHDAADALRQIDALFEAMPTSAPFGDDLEAAVAARRKRQPATTASSDADLEAAIAARRKRKPVPSAAETELEAEIAARRKTLACPNCGKPIQSGDAFCSKCGTPLGTQVAR